VSGVEAAIAFSFFSIFTFAGLTALAVMRFRQGAGDAFSTTYDHEGGVTQPTPSPYSTYAGGESGDPYQQPPFGEEKRGPPPGDFSAPTY